MKCAAIPGAIFCGPDTDVEHVIVKGKKVYFTYDRQFGPLVTDKRGDPLKRQPGDHSDFWPPFNVWLKTWRANNPEPQPRPDPSERLDRR